MNTPEGSTAKAMNRQPEGRAAQENRQRLSKLTARRGAPPQARTVRASAARRDYLAGIEDERAWLDW
jgi:Flp pilus assembly protein TadD